MSLCKATNRLNPIGAFRHLLIKRQTCLFFLLSPEGMPLAVIEAMASGTPL